MSGPADLVAEKGGSGDTTKKIWKKYEGKYTCPIEPTQFDRATKIDGATNAGVGVLCKCERPHMRGFHGAWLGFFIAFVSWFAFAPLMGEIRPSLGLSKNDIWIANLCSVGGTVGLRFLAGPYNDVYGPRVLMSSLLMGGGLIVFLGGTIESAAGLATIRFFVGMLGAAFVMCQYWTSMMFAKSVVGTANAWSAGWGNLGGGVTQVFMGAMVFPLMKAITGNDIETAWRTSFIIPGILTCGIGYWIRNYTDDCPYGNYWEMKQNGHKLGNAAVSTRRGGSNITAWILFVQYACCFGVELHMNNLAALYFRDKFDLSTEASSTIASLFGLMNLFARTLGGVSTDIANKVGGMRGRLWAQTICLFLEGLFIIIFAAQNDLAAAIVCLICFSTFVQMSEGTSYGIVPYIDPPVTGMIAGIVGAGGNVGAVCWSFIWIFGDDIGNSQDKLRVLGTIVMVVSVLSTCMKIKGHPAIIPIFTDEMVNTGLDDERSWIFTAEAEACKKKCDEEGRAFDPVAERAACVEMATKNAPQL